MRSASEVLAGLSPEGRIREQIERMLAHPPEGLPPGTVFAPNDRCPACGGLVHDDSEEDGVRCRCAGALRRCERQADAADPEARMTFGTLDLGGDPSLRRAAASAKRVALGERRGLVMLGPPGTGKTHVAISACRLALSNRTTAAFFNVTELVSRVQATYGRGWSSEGESRGDVIAEVTGRDLVVLDDLGKERDSGDVASIIYELVDDVYRSGTRLIVASNLATAEYRARYDEAVTSRIAGMCEAVPVLGPDRRRSA